MRNAHQCTMYSSWRSGSHSQEALLGWWYQVSGLPWQRFQDTSRLPVYFLRLQSIQNYVHKKCHSATNQLSLRKIYALPTRKAAGRASHIESAPAKADGRFCGRSASATSPENGKTCIDSKCPSNSTKQRTYSCAALCAVYSKRNITKRSNCRETILLGWLAVLRDLPCSLSFPAGKAKQVMKRDACREVHCEALFEFLTVLV